MKAKLLTLVLMLMSLSACKMTADDGKSTTDTTAAASTSPNNTSTQTSLEGQIFYTAEELKNNPVPTGFGDTIGGYHLDGLRVFLSGQHNSYELYPDFNGNFSADDIDPGSYQLFIKSYETFIDKGGDYTYEYFTNINLKKGEHTVLPLMHVRKTYFNQPSPSPTPSATPAAVSNSQQPIDSGSSAQ